MIGDLHEALAMSNSLDLVDTVDGQVDVFELPQLVESLHLRDKVTLQVQDLQVAAIDVQILDLLQILLMQRDLYCEG